MRKQIEIMIVFSIFLMLIPLYIFSKQKMKRNPPAMLKAEQLKILFTEKDKVEEISMQDYMIGAVLAQMPADFEEEALNASCTDSYIYPQASID